MLSSFFNHPLDLELSTSSLFIVVAILCCVSPREIFMEGIFNNMMTDLVSVRRLGIMDVCKNE
jgi:sterol desaturase/sphingolipid hydroxylase (fatty acid hydroxylase superfamily)